MGTYRPFFLAVILSSVYASMAIYSGYNKCHAQYIIVFYQRSRDFDRAKLIEMRQASFTSVLAHGFSKKLVASEVHCAKRGDPEEPGNCAFKQHEGAFDTHY